MLEVLLGARGNVVSAEELLERVWDEHVDPMTNVVPVTVMTLRRKLGAPPVIDTVKGAGLPDRAMRLPRPTVRIRLTLLYGSLFLVAGGGPHRGHALPLSRRAR